MVVIGVTGGVGTGKSTVARLFGRWGAAVLDADRIAHELMEPGTPVYRKIRRVFGPEGVGSDGRVDRKRLGSTVFKSRRRLKQLTGIVHPAVRRRIQTELKRLRREKPNGVAVLDIPLLVESGPVYPTTPVQGTSFLRSAGAGRRRRRRGWWGYRTDALVVVSAPAAVAARRLKRRSGWSPKEIQRRGRFQLPLSQKQAQADFVVHNGGGLSSTRRQALSIWKQIVKERKRHGGGKDG